ncbi:3,4-dihydroxy-2-butanone-4-phosphate synthase [Pandoraea bronchicola]|uniref:3,4-dihydroxy-2-butanone 4-phosphate synthase n=1 Tax=Pandoraea bronchicola TaxID=2508287 RepID=A0A5E5BVZ7_9BURK|nr:3,4-dihydroxy-2-butanone-4-phosphate synthase [Pandoraea bronchicola]VVE89628.1 3,4-dihydroxy-2-butanone 4-phosphate synthase/GTP cyclohydrolase II-like protein [Pandoraea bronchicola]
MINDGIRQVRETETRISSAQEIINEARNGRMFILVDDEDRENEGDLVIPAQMATPEAINFMATHGRGLICLALSEERVDQLRLEPMSRANGTRHETAFTVSIEAREGVSTGISAADRARTISVAIDTAKGPADIVSPGHVFPLRARDGGVLIRAGHTEASVDVARLAGLNPSGVICEIMKDDGTMARLDDLIVFARKHGMKIGTIRDLIAHRLLHDHPLEQRAAVAFHSRWGGPWQAHVFWNKASKTEQVALVKGVIDPERPVLVRMHALSIFADAFGEVGEQSSYLAQSMQMIAKEGAGVVVIINKPRADAFTAAVRLRGQDDRDAEVKELRDYGAGAMVLAELGIRQVILLSNHRHSLVAVSGYGLSVLGERRIDVAVAP